MLPSARIMVRLLESIFDGYSLYDDIEEKSIVAHMD